MALGAAALVACVSAVPTPSPVVSTPTVAPSPTGPEPTPVLAAPTATVAQAVTAAPTSQMGFPVPSPSPSPTSPAPATSPSPSLSPSSSSSASPSSVSPGPSPVLRLGGQPIRDVAATPDGRHAFAVAGGELYRLDGADWKPTGHRPPAGRLLALDADRMVVGEMPGCARGGGSPLRWTGSGGVGWRDAAGPGDAPLSATPWLARGSELYALGCAGTFLSVDGGRTYRAAPALTTQNYDPADLAIAPDGATAYLAAVSEGGSLRVLRAERRGADWAAPTTIDTGWSRAAVAAGSGGRVVLAGALAVKLSDDRGATWRSISRGLEAELLSTDPTKSALPDSDQRKLQAGYGVDDLLLREDLIYAATPHGVYTRKGESAWERVTTTKTARLIALGNTVYAVTPEGVAPLAS